MNNEKKGKCQSKRDVYKRQQPGQRVVIVDDLIATGGTSAAMAQMIEEAGGIVAGFMFVIELAGLEGRKVLSQYPVYSLVSYEGK